MQLEIDLDNEAFELTIEPSMGASYNEFWSHTEMNGKCEAKFNLEGLEIFPEMTSRIIAAFRDYPEEVISNVLNPFKRICCHNKRVKLIIQTVLLPQ